MHKVLFNAHLQGFCIYLKTREGSLEFIQGPWDSEIHAKAEADFLNLQISEEGREDVIPN